MSEGSRYLTWAFLRGTHISKSIVASEALERKFGPKLSLSAACFISVANSLSKAFHLWALEVELVGFKVRFLLSV